MSSVSDRIRGEKAASWQSWAVHSGLHERNVRVVVRGAEVTQRGALLTVLCLNVGWLSLCGPGVGTVRPSHRLVGACGFGFRACHSP